MSSKTISKQQKTKAKYEKWQDAKGLNLDVFWMEDGKAVIFGFNSTKATKMSKDEMEEQGFLKQ